jgi:hypothetical protein
MRFLESFGPACSGPAAKDLGPLLHRVSRLRRNPASRGLYDGNFWKSLESRAGTVQENDLRTAFRECAELERRFQAIRSARPDALGVDVALQAVHRVRFMAKMTGIANRLAQCEDDLSALPALLEEVRLLRDDLRAIREEYTRLWNAENRPWWLDRNLSKFERLDAELSRMLDGPTLLPLNRVFVGEVAVRLAAGNPGETIRYTLDGSEPDASSPIYRQPIRLTRTTKIKARVGNGPVAEATYRTTTVPARLSSDLAAYEGHVLFHVLDRDPQTFFWSFGAPPEGAHITAEFLQPQRVRRIRVLTGQPWNPSGDRMYDGVVEVLRGGQWAKVAEFRDGTAEAELDGGPLDGVRIRSLHNPGFWLVVREIFLETD